MSPALHSLSRVSSSVAAGLALGLIFVPACKRQDAAAPASAPVASAPAGGAVAGVGAAASSVAGPSAAKAKGRWLRPDGGYILAITAIDADGRAEAGYFNPNPIRVAWATVTAEGAELKVKVELRDENYPGCLYKLTYVPDKDRLVGTYFQAQMQQTYEVEFVREP